MVVNVFQKRVQLNWHLFKESCEVVSCDPSQISCLLARYLHLNLHTDGVGGMPSRPVVGHLTSVVVLLDIFLSSNQQGLWGGGGHALQACSRPSHICSRSTRHFSKQQSANSK